MMAKTIINKELLALGRILEVIPPNEWRLECSTVDQLNHWGKVHHDYSLICKDFQASIQGQQSPLDEMKLDKTYKEYIRVRTRSYKSLFDALWEGWSEVRTVLQKVDPKEANIDRMPKCPGEAVFAIVLQDAKTAFRRCLQPYSELSSNQLVQVEKRRRKREKLDALPISEESEKEMESLSRKDRNFAHLAGIGDYKTLREWIFPVLEEKFRNDPTENPMKAYRRHAGDLGRLTLKLNHSRNQAGKEVWKNGVLETTGKMPYVTET